MDAVEKVAHAWPEPPVKLQVDVILPGVGWFLHLESTMTGMAIFQNILQATVRNNATREVSFLLPHLQKKLL